MTPKDIIRKFKEETGCDLFFEDNEFLLIDPMSFTGLPINSLPDNLRVEGNLSLNNCPISSLPKKLRVAGSLSLTKTQITSLPKDLKVGEDLILRYTPITSLPKDLKVGGDLDVSSTQLSSLPEGLQLGGSLDISYTPITSLPKDLKVGGNLNASSTQLSSLPKGLELGGSLDISYTPITSLPKDLKVGGDLDASSSQLSSLPEGLQLGGSLYLQYSSVKSLPDGMKVNGELDLSNTPIASLPTGLKVAGTVYLNDTPLTTLPDKLQVEGYLDISNTSIQSLPDDLQVQKDIVGFKGAKARHYFIEYANSNNEEDNELNYEEEENYYELESWENDEDFIIRLNKLKEDITLSFRVCCDNHSADKWHIFNYVYISLKDNKALLCLEGSIKVYWWSGPENIQHLFKNLSEEIGKSGIFIHSAEKDLDLDNWCSIRLRVLIDKDFMFFKTVNSYLKLLGDLEAKAQKRWKEKYKKENEIHIIEESNKEAINFIVENAESNNEEVNEFDNKTEGEYCCDGWKEEKDVIIRLNKLVEDGTVSFNFREYGYHHSADKWEIFHSVNISLKDNKALLSLYGSIKVEMWDGPENIQHLLKNLSEEVGKSGIFIHSAEEDLELDKWCSIRLRVLIDKDFMFFKTVNSYMKLIGDLEAKAQKKLKGEILK